MKSPTLFLKKAMPPCLAIVTLVCAAAAALAQEDLKSQEPSMETKAAPEPEPLKGSVTRLELDEQQKLQSGVGKQGSIIDGGKLRIFGFARKHKLTAEDYRNLEFGITGFISTKIMFAGHPVVTKLFHGCPAEVVGIRLGDRLIRANNHDFTWHDMQKEYWQYLDGRAGTPVDLTVKRHGEELTFRITRMNIEDIPDDGVRRMFERMVRTLGAPGSGLSD